MSRLGDWIDERAGHRALVRSVLTEPVPGGARWAYVWGSALTLSLVVQAVTGWLLMSAYAPSATTAWASTAYLSHHISGGWLIRGLHHFGAQAMIVLLAAHLMQTALHGAYRRPRELNWYFGLGLLGVTLGFLAPLLVFGLGAGLLTVKSRHDDAGDEVYQEARALADARAARALTLAEQGVPPEGPLAMLRDDPEDRGGALFTQHCVACHRLGDLTPAEGKATAPDLTGYDRGSRQRKDLREGRHRQGSGRPHAGLHRQDLSC